MIQDNKEHLLRKRLQELASMAYYKKILTYTDFLNLNEISIFHSMGNELLFDRYQLYGGYKGAERQILFFTGDESFDSLKDFISCIHIVPLNKKFSDKLTHRDFLGAILNLGIQRGKIGDILTRDREGYVFCDKNISEFIISNLTKIKHTNVKCILLDSDSPVLEPNFINIYGSISSNRLDSLIAVAMKTSRSSVSGLISGGKVFVNSKVILSNSYLVKDDEIISIRGYGKYIYKGVQSQTKKGKLRVLLLKYD